MTLTEILVYVLAFLVGSVACARLIRLWTQDSFPPVVWLRTRFVAAVGPDSEWAVLAECPWCAAMWITLPNVVLAYATDLHWVWWAVNLTLAATYFAAWIVVHDED